MQYSYFCTSFIQCFIHFYYIIFIYNFLIISFSFPFLLRYLIKKYKIICNGVKLHDEIHEIAIKILLLLELNIAFNFGEKNKFFIFCINAIDRNLFCYFPIEIIFDK